jgi:putative ABC transport system permease protein
MRNQKLGVNIDQTLVLKGADSLQDSLYGTTFQPFKTELLKQPEIRSVAASSNVMGKEIYWTNGTRRLDSQNETSVTLYYMGLIMILYPVRNKITSGQKFFKGF